MQWNQAVLPAGEYFIQVNANGTPAIMYSAGARKSVNNGAPMVSDLEKGAAHLAITIRGNERKVRSMNLPGIGESLVFDPLTKTEREVFAKAG